jgi:RNA polymerase sigma-70 factor (ECF subfamily)
MPFDIVGNPFDPIRQGRFHTVAGPALRITSQGGVLATLRTVSSPLHKAALARLSSRGRGVVSVNSAASGVPVRDADQNERGLRAQLHRFVLGKIGDRCDSDDLVQEAFVRFYAYRSERKVEDVGAFCFTVARNLIRDRFRRSRTTPAFVDMPDDLACPQSRADEIMVHRQRVAVLSSAIEAMPALRREVFLRRRLDGDDVATISREIGLSASAIEKHVTRAVADLRRALDRRGLWIGDPA